LIAEGPGILRWMIEGCLGSQANGLVRPGSVRDATDAYFSGQDVFGEWLRERCICEPENPRRKATTHALFESWGSFVRANNEQVGSMRSFTDGLEGRGFISIRNVPTPDGRRVRGFSGIELRPFSDYEPVV
jgi:putative DNA primase/helicase